MRADTFGLAASGALGVLCAYALYSSLAFAPYLAPASAPSPLKVSVSVRAAASDPVPTSSSVPAKKQARAQPRPAALPLPVPFESERKLSEAASVSEPSMALPTISQPSFSGPSSPEPELLPLIPGDSAPPVPTSDPFEGKSFAEKPGGDVLVLGLLLNETGMVVDSRILVPSSAVLGDLSVLYASRGQRWTDLYPPLVPGETRWIEYRVDQRAAFRQQQTLP